MDMFLVFSIFLVGSVLGSPMTSIGNQDGERTEKTINKRYIMEGITLWPTTNVYYKFDTKQPITAKDKEIAKNALAEIQKNTCFKFTENNAATRGLNFDRPPMLMGPCLADVGYQKERLTNVHLPTRCGDMPAVVHEIFHALGHGHEQGSSNRYRTAIVNWDVLKEDARSGYIARRTKFNENIDPYDIYSVMHYGINTKQFNKKLILLDPRQNDYYLDDTKGDYGIGDMNRDLLDYKKINTIYKCTEPCKNMKCENTGYAAKTDKVCRCICPTDFTGPTCETFKPVNSKKNCNEVHYLDRNTKTVTIRSPQDDANPETYKKGARCNHFIKALPGYRVKATIKKLELVVTQNINAYKDCLDHWVGFSIDRIDKRVYKYCGTIPRPGKIQEVFLKSTLTPEANLMKIIFDSTSDNGQGTHYNGTGVEVEVTAYESACIKNQDKCRPPSLCVDTEDMTSYKCMCTDGYSGPTCSDVKKDSVVTTDFDNNMKRLSFFKVDPSAKDVKLDLANEFSQYLDDVETKFGPPANSGSYVFGTFSSDNPGSATTPGRLTTEGVNFEEGKRCLSFKFLLKQAKAKDTASFFAVWVSGDGVARKRLWKRESSKDSKWESAQLDIPSLKSLKIEFEYTEHDVLVAAVDDFVLQPTCSGPCFPNPCKSSGRCSVSKSGIKCSCTYGFSGKHCEIRPCPDYYCQNGGMCYVKESKSACHCKIPFSGPKCENTICSSDKCGHGKCLPLGKDIVPQFECDCETGWEGPACNKKKAVANPCEPNPCKNNGQCEVGTGTASCYCNFGYSGPRCEKSPCDTITCQNGGKCEPITKTEAMCKCGKLYNGDRCEKKICEPNPCKNGGTCELAPTLTVGYKCNCKPGFNEPVCEKDEFISIK